MNNKNDSLFGTGEIRNKNEEVDNSALINASISWNHLSVGHIKSPMCLFLFMCVCLVPFIRQCYMPPLFRFSAHQGE